MHKPTIAVLAALVLAHAAHAAPARSHSPSSSVHAQFAAKDATIALLKKQLAVQQRTLDAEAEEIDSLKSLILLHNIPLPQPQQANSGQYYNPGQQQPQQLAPAPDPDDPSTDPGQDSGDALKRAKSLIRNHGAGGGYNLGE